MYPTCVVKVLLLFVLGVPPRIHMWPLSTFSPPTKHESSIDLPLFISPSMAHLKIVYKRKILYIKMIVYTPHCRYKKGRISIFLTFQIEQNHDVHLSIPNIFKLNCFSKLFGQVI